MDSDDDVPMLTEIRDALKAFHDDMVSIGNDQLSVQQDILSLLQNYFGNNTEEDPTVTNPEENPSVSFDAVEDNTEMSRDLDLKSKFSLFTDVLTDKDSQAPVITIPFSQLLQGTETFSIDDYVLDFSSEPFATLNAMSRTVMCGVIFLGGLFAIFRTVRTFES